MSWTLTLTITLGRDPAPERDTDHVGTHHDVGPVEPDLGFAVSDATNHTDGIRVPKRPENAGERNLVRPSGNTATGEGRG